jgi:hypothetical protein
MGTVVALEDLTPVEVDRVVLGAGDEVELVTTLDVVPRLATLEDEPGGTAWSIFSLVTNKSIRDALAPEVRLAV